MLYRTKQGLNNLSRPHFKTTSWHFPNHVNDWPSIDSIDTPLSRGSRFFVNEISHAERAFFSAPCRRSPCKSHEAHDRRPLDFFREVLNRIEFLTAHNRTSPLATEIQKVILVQFRCSLYKIISPKLFDKQEFRTYFQRRGRDSNSWYGKPVRQFSKLVVSATHPPLLK